MSLTISVLGSSSKGNCYVLDNGFNKIALDCGVKNTTYKWSELDGIILTHFHKDHCGNIKNIKDYYKNYYYSNMETLKVIPIIDEYMQEVKAGKKFYIATFEIVAFELMHDATCYGYLIKDTISNTKLVYITDTGMIDYKFNDIDYFLIESNNDEDLLTYEDYKEQRLYDTHLSMQQTLEFLKNNINHNTKKIILCHISTSEENYLKHQDFIQNGINNNAIQVIALNPKQKGIRKIILKEDFNQFNFD